MNVCAVNISDTIKSHLRDLLTTISSYIEVFHPNTVGTGTTNIYKSFGLSVQQPFNLKNEIAVFLQSHQFGSMAIDRLVKVST